MKRDPIHILCVDDEVHVLSLVNDALREAGFEVRTALDGAHALQHIATARREFDIMIVDVRMPNLDGWRLIVAARGAGYRGKVIVVSGHLDDDERKRFGDLNIDAVLEKPLRPAELVRAVKDVAPLSAIAR